eukprot:TRINITY_DN416_c0_g1_i1.p1 TRINITY_DN416_c0_g1~~TRINITY_DN416_c0_g1_i1.p1  ORF type:complete len:155 (-),score=45.85 TRINITY_DN416_c0_g1_i1:141-605(-)
MCIRDSINAEYMGNKFKEEMKIAILLGLLVAVAVCQDGVKYAKRAESLLGRSRAEFVCNQVNNWVLFGKKDTTYQGRYMLADQYLNVGQRIPDGQRQPGDVIVGLDGAHCGMIGSDLNIIHSSSSKYAIIKIPFSSAQWTFPSGWQIRRVKGTA